MLTLTLFRHAKSSWNSTAKSDHERPLNKRGVGDAPIIAEELLQRGVSPDRCIVSTAVRTRQTANALIESGLVREENVQFYSELYLASADKLLETVQLDYLTQHGTLKNFLVLAHNPGLEILADTLSGYQTGPMPTAAVAHFNIQADDFAVVSTTNTSLEFFIAPKLLSQPDAFQSNG